MMQFLCRLPLQERHIGITLFPVVVCCCCCLLLLSVVKKGLHLALSSTCFDGYNQSWVIDLLMRSKVIYQGQRSSEVKL